MTDPRIRLLRADDWDTVVALEERAYATSGLSEGRDALQSRHRASPSTCFVLEHAGHVGGYLLALPYPLHHCPDLSHAENSTGHKPPTTNMHAHDLVIAEELRGHGHAHRMLRHLEATARAAGYRTLSLVAVRGSHVLWTPLGYRARPETDLPASYGDEAVYMAMRLTVRQELLRETASRPVRDRALPLPHSTDPVPGPRPRAEVG